ncbi:D-alanyl-D-alanine carboxypeptidase/D-alanyl-D-alanine endopeptidase [Bacillus sp. Marseille-P3661]|uniref:D-alanyl-D-alanine carboxypeptidase/D-alanyl-D-alanine endopeptidase n=1 Tax=Bacillus sp. Marseille-P3661 TaxID=1936234 RepID=UPI000C81F57C|nr:D-alanyl-D-alanine carboxypeptidase/D-alanyl-D-alanine-endopeptidase [Bacillus sp. Marseille-P3661]
MIIIKKSWKWNKLNVNHKGIYILVITVLVALLPPFLNSDAYESEQILSAEINRLLQEDPILKGALAGISIRSASTGDILYEHNGDIRMRPASNMKLFTATAALSVLGETHQFKTEIRTKGTKEGNRLKGNLYLKGFGDATLLREDLTTMAIDIAKSGIEVIVGDLIVDDSWYDDVRLSPDLVWSDESYYYGAQISALTVSPNKEFDAGTILMEMSPGSKIGAPAKIQISHKTNYVNIINQTVTLSHDGEADLIIDRKHGSNTIIVKGFLPMGAPVKKEWIAVWEPTQFVMDLFKQELAKQGIHILGAAKLGETPKGTSLLTSHQSMPLSEFLIPFMKLSNNIHAEVLVKEMGKLRKGEGSWEKGLEVVKEELPKFGVNLDSFVIRDGSGISHVNLIPANEISKLLFHIQKEKWFPAFVKSLPVAGNSEKMVGGSLRKRMKSLNVKAKTGTLTTVTSLSGYVATKKGETLIFSILLNNLLDEDKGKVVEDRIVEILANY